MRRLIICALGASVPGTMGGNTKITIEMARCLSGERDVHIFLPRYKLPTFENNLPADHGIVFHALDDYPGDEKFQPLRTVKWYTPRVRDLFRELNISSDDVVFGCSDFHMDVLPLYRLQKEFSFRWIPSVFLFVPFVFENLARGYRFPALKYLVYWFYQRALFFLMKRRASAFVITNTCDAKYFPKRFKDRLFAYYGGVNVEQIPPPSARKTRDVVFCSRLHPQKGIDAFLDTWKIVHDHLPNVRLTVIGNGEPAYERYLKDKSARLGLDDSIDWRGYVNNEAKYGIYAEARLFVHPTVFDNNGMVAAEALCTGLPVVMRDLPNLRHVYTTGCRKVPFGDTRAFAEAIVELLSDESARAALAPSAADIFALCDHWNWESRAREFSAWLNQLV